MRIGRAGLAIPALAALLTAAAPPAAELEIGSGSSLGLGTGRLDLGCADLTVAGTLSAGSEGFGAARDVTIEPGGVLNGGSASLEVAGDWDNAGSFDAGTSTVRLVDGCGLVSAVIAGSSTFADLELTTTSGKLYRFESGSTQEVEGSLALHGTQGDLLTIRSTVDGSEAFLDVQGTGRGEFVDVRDNDASAGRPIVLEPGSVKGPNTAGWSLVPSLPSLSRLGRALAVLLVVWAGARAFGFARPRARGSSA